MFDKSKVASLAIKVCQMLQQAGYQSYLVGGCVRDLLLDITPKDYDIATNAKPQQIKQVFSKTYDTGIAHGTITVSMGDTVDDHFEVTTYRTEGEYSDGRRPDSVGFVNEIELDLARRDLTINAMAYDPIKDQLVDPYSGIQDLTNKIIRAVGNPNKRFSEDGLRIMRVARFAARFNFFIDSATVQAMTTNLDTLSHISKERIRDELTKILMTSYPTHGLLILKTCGALSKACPLLMSESILSSSVELQNNCSGQLEARIAFLYSYCKTEFVEEELIKLKFSNKEIKEIIFLLNALDNYEKFRKYNNISSYIDFMDFFKNKSPLSWDFMLDQFILLTEAMGIKSTNLLEKYNNIIVFSRKEMKINGDDLLVMGMLPGPQIKNKLDMLYKEILNHPEFNEKSKLLELASQ